MSGKVDQTVADVATRTFAVETTRQPAEQENSAFERRFTNAKYNRFLGWNPGPQTIRGHVISDAMIDGEFSAVWNKDGLVRGTGYLRPDDDLMQVSIADRNVIMSPEDSTVIIGCNLLYHNYFHWITQALPAIDFSLRRDGQVRTVALGLPVLRPWQEESLRLLGYDGIKRVTLDDTTKFYGFKNVEFNGLVNGGASFCLSGTAYQTYSRLWQEVPKQSPEGRKIYIARTDSLRRRMRNENALLDAMRARGFEIVVPGALTLTEQIRVFREASVVVGPHGAGLTNIVFCEPGTIVYELVPDHYPNICFGNLALICGLRYWADSFVSDGDGHPSARDWDADLAIVTERVDEIETIRADLQREEADRTIGAMDFLRGRPGRLSDRPAAIQPVAIQKRSGWLRRLLGR
jgi:hypothetical protein